MKDKVMNLTKEILETFFPTEIVAFEVFGEEYFDFLKNNKKGSFFNSSKGVEFEAGDSRNATLDFLSILKATYTTLKNSDNSGDVNLDLSNVFKEELIKAGVKKEISIEISMKFTEKIIEPNYSNTNQESTKSYFKNILQKNDLEGIFTKSFAKDIPTEIKDEFILLKGQYEATKRKKIEGTIAIEEENLVMNKLRSSILSLLNQI